MVCRCRPPQYAQVAADGTASGALLSSIRGFSKPPPSRAAGGRRSARRSKPPHGRLSAHSYTLSCLYRQYSLSREEHIYSDGQVRSGGRRRGTYLRRVHTGQPALLTSGREEGPVWGAFVMSRSDSNIQRVDPARGWLGGPAKPCGYRTVHYPVPSLQTGWRVARRVRAPWPVP